MRRGPRKLWCAPEVSEDALLAGLARGASQLAQLALCAIALLESLLERIRVARNCRLELPVDVESDRERRQARRRTPSAWRIAWACGLSAFIPGPSEEGDDQHRHRRADRVREREDDRPGSDVLRRADDRDRSEHGPGARDEDEPEARPEQEAAAELAAGLAREPEQRPLNDLLEPRPEQRRSDEEEQGDREVAQDVLGQAERSQEPDPEERERRRSSR